MAELMCLTLSCCDEADVEIGVVVNHGVVVITVVGYGVE